MADAAGGSPAPELFARMAVKTLTPEQMYDPLDRVGLRPSAQQQSLADPRRQAFLVKMQTQTRSVTDFEISVPQALALLNGLELNELTGTGGELLAALESPLLDDAERVEVAFLGTLSRRARDSERSQFVEYVQSKPSAERTKAVGDIVWALLNTAEFVLNH